MTYPVSILDLSPISLGFGESQAVRSSIHLAIAADQLGFTRYWVAEHHNIPSVASSAPEVLIAHLAQVTRRIRVGSGGIMLPNHSPLHVAEVFKVLSALHPGRIDLGIGRAPGSNLATALALRGSKERLNVDDFPERLEELFRFAADGFPLNHPFHRIRAIPEDAHLPPVWILGSSLDGAFLAAEFGIGFAFANHINPGEMKPATQLYRQRFVASRHLAAPKLILATAAYCAPTDEEAERIATTAAYAWMKLRTNQPEPLRAPDDIDLTRLTDLERSLMENARRTFVVGSPARVRDQLVELAGSAGADEIMITSAIFNLEDRIRSYRLIADVFQLDTNLSQQEAEPAFA